MNLRGRLVHRFRVQAVVLCAFAWTAFDSRSRLGRRLQIVADRIAALGMALALLGAALDQFSVGVGFLLVLGIGVGRRVFRWLSESRPAVTKDVYRSASSIDDDNQGDGPAGAPVFAKLPPGPRGPLVGAAAKQLPLPRLRPRPLPKPGKAA